MSLASMFGWEADEATAKHRPASVAQIESLMSDIRSFNENQRS